MSPPHFVFPRPEQPSDSLVVPLPTGIAKGQCRPGVGESGKGESNIELVFGKRPKCAYQLFDKG